MSVQEMIITLTCPTCGAKLKLGQDTNLVYCTSCGNEHFVNRGEGSIYLAPMAANVAQIRTGVDKTAAELAVVRLQKEIDELNAQFTLISESDYITKIPAYGREGWTQLATLVSAIAAFVCVYNNAIGLAQFFVIAVFIGFGFLAMTHGKRRKQGNALQVQELTDLDRAIDSKKAMLQRNQAIANS